MKRFPFLACLVLLLLLLAPAGAAGTPGTANGLLPVPPTITGISPETWPANSVVTLRITGTGLGDVTKASLNKCALRTGSPGQPPFNGNIISQSSIMITATFDLSGKKVGDYDVIVYAPEGVAQDKQSFTVYAGSGPAPTTTTTTTEDTTTVTETTVTSGQGENSVFFESNPTGAEVWLEGEDIGTTAFTWYTNRDGTYDVVVKKIGYEDYEARVTVIKGQRVHFSAFLTPLIETSVNTSKTTKTTTTAKPATNVTTIEKSTLKVPTPWGPDPTFTEESPADPAIALLAAVFGLGFLVMRRR